MFMLQSSGQSHRKFKIQNMSENSDVGGQLPAVFSSTVHLPGSLGGTTPVRAVPSVVFAFYSVHVPVSVSVMQGRVLWGVQAQVQALCMATV